MQFRTLETSTIDILTETFNLAFADYEIPFHLTPEDLSQKFRTEDIDLSFSVGAFDGDKLVGFIFFGMDDDVQGVKTAWDGGTGVIPEHRGQKLTQRMFDFMLPVLKATGVKKILLEVLERNTGARGIYESLGFTVTRKLNAYKGIVQSAKTSPHKVALLQNADYNFLLKLGNVQPAWQQMNKRVANPGNDILTYVVQINDVIAGYAHYNKNRHRLQQIAVAPAHRRKGIGTALLQHIAAQNPEALLVINIDDRSESINGFFPAIGMKWQLSQYEMELEL